jgi:hypothetical protein
MILLLTTSNGFIQNVEKNPAQSAEKMCVWNPCVIGLLVGWWMQRIIIAKKRVNG